MTTSLYMEKKSAKKDNHFNWIRFRNFSVIVFSFFFPQLDSSKSAAKSIKWLKNSDQNLTAKYHFLAWKSIFINQRTHFEPMLILRRKTQSRLKLFIKIYQTYINARLFQIICILFSKKYLSPINMKAKNYLFCRSTGAHRTFLPANLLVLREWPQFHRPKRG